MEKMRRFVMDISAMAVFKAILESYEEVGMISVIDNKRGIIELVYPMFFEDDIEEIMKDVACFGIRFHEINPPLSSGHSVVEEVSP